MKARYDVFGVLYNNNCMSNRYAMWGISTNQIQSNGWHLMKDLIMFFIYVE